TRSVVLRLCAQTGIPAREGSLQRHDLYIADECFLTGTGAEIIAVTRIDGRSVGTGMVGPITRSLTAAFHKLVRQGT
ncbi:MAG TPA: aminotransferase class IV, partial [Tepidisphaeraceae bacterium]|nr:aminotransferase class IV [Tepidisphaeraceae bacterium]